MRTFKRTQSKRWLNLFTLITLLLGLLLPASLVVMAQGPAPTIQSDKADYAPGELVKLNGQNWQGDAKVYIAVKAGSGNSWTYARTVNVAGDGTIRDAFKLPDYFVDAYTVTATGSTTSRVAKTSFTDASIGGYAQCSNDTGTGYTTGDTGCRWVNGNLNPSNSYYVEGDASVQRLWLTGFVPGTTHTVTFHVGTTQSGTHAYDFLTSWNWSESWITLADRCENVTGCSTATETVIDIPQDPNVPDIFEPSAPGDRRFVMRGGTLNSVTTPVIAHGTYATNSDTEITVSFTVASTGSMCPISGPDRGTCGVVLWFGAHVGISAEWQLYDGTIGAGNISGSPYHVALEMVDGASVGNRDNQMQTSASNGTIVITKDAVPNDAQDFSFNLNNNSTSNFNFLLDDDTNPVLPNSRSLSLPPGVWTASELNIPAGWMLTGLTCVDPTNNTVVNLATGQASINLATNETVTCTYTNTKAGTITVAKVTSPPGSTQSFVFTPSWSNSNFSLTHGQSHGSGLLVPGTYSVSEAVPAGWQLQGAACSDNSPVNAISLSAGENITCTFTNQFVPNPVLNVVKSSTTTLITAVGQVVPYTFVVTNGGNVALTGVTVSDPKCTSAIAGPTGDNGDNILQLTETWTYTCTHTVTQADIDAGANLPNTVTADSNETTPRTASLAIPITRTPALTLVKTANPKIYDAVGDQIIYDYVLLNEGNVTLTGPFTVTDDKATVTCIQPADGALSPAETMKCTATYIITQADLNAGSVTNTATGQGFFGNSPVTSNQDSETVNAVQSPALTLVKTATPLTYDAVGDVIGYSYLLTNSGNVTLSAPFTVTDNKATATCPTTPTSLAPLASITCSASYTITQADLDASSVTNTATGQGRFGAAAVLSNQDSETVTAIPLPALTLVKTATPTTYSAVGDVIGYSYLLTNSGNVTLSAPFTVTDNKATATCPASPTSLAPLASITCSASYIITQADLDAGSVTNTATGQGFFGNSPVTSNQDSETVNAVQSPALTLVKTATPTTYSAVGDVISYSYLLTNSGNVPLNSPFTVTDNKATVTCPATPTLLAPLASIICSASYTITQADLDAGSVTNTARGHGLFDRTPVDSNEDSETVNAVQSPALTLVKTATPLTYDAVGDVIGYSYLLTNSGNVTLSAPFTVTDNKAAATCPASPTSLAPLASITCSASYIITQADLDAGSVTNTATGQGFFGNSPVTSNQDSETVTAIPLPALTLVKTATPTTYSAVGDVIGYSYLLTNSGNVTLSAPFTVTDNKATVTCPATPTLLAPLASITCSASYTITQADLDAGSVTNTATGQGFFGNSPVISNQDSETVTAIPLPALTLVKTATPTTYSAVGDVIGYSYLLTNSGNVTLSAPFTVTDNKATVTCPATPTLLAPLASITCSASYTITQADLDAGSVTNTATGQGFFGNNPVISNQDSETVNAVQSPALTLVKIATPNVFDSIGDIINYSYTLTNSGNVTLSGPFTVTDDKATVTCPATTSLAPLASITCNATYTITAADFTLGSVTNIATAHSFFGTTPIDSNIDTVTVNLVANADVAIVKIVSTATAVPGEILSYTLVIANNGPSPATGVTVTDALPAGLSFISALPAQNSGPNPLVWNLGDLANGGTATITVQARVTATSGSLVNTATVTTTTIDPNPTNNTSTATTSVLTPSLTVQKTVSVGEVVRNMPFSYTIRIENTGQVPLVPVEVIDTLPAGFHFITGSATPQQPDLVAEPVLRWNNVGLLGVGQAITISFNVTAAPGTIGTYINTVDVTGSYNCVSQAVICGSVGGTDTASVAVADPVVDVLKSLVAADLDAIAPNYITFTVDVSNPGISVIDILPLVDAFDSTVLRFVSATVPPNTSTAVGGAGVLTWTDLTGPTNGFNANLAPGQHFIITTVFEVIATITTTTNTVTVSNSIDVLNNPAAEVTDAVTVTNVPTAVTSKYFKATRTGSRAIRLEWATAVEFNIQGFKLYRATVNDYSQAASIGYKSASGSSSVYMMNDQLPSYGHWYYWLVAVGMDGDEEVITQTDVIDYQFQVFVPMVRR